LSQKKLYKKSTNTITVTLTDSAKVLVTGATATATLVDGLGVDVPNAIAVVLTELAPTTNPGVYTGTIEEAFDPPVATNYVLQVTALQGGRQLYGEASVAVQVYTIK
jgi:hypothetical protein